VQDIPENVELGSQLYWEYRLRNELNSRWNRVANHLVALKKRMYEQRCDDGCILGIWHWLVNQWGESLLRRRNACEERIRILEHQIWIKGERE